MDRRLFVKLSAFSAAAISFSLLDGCQTSSLQKQMASPELLSHILEKEILMEIGKAYIAKAPSEQTEDKIISSLLAGSTINESSDKSVINSFLLNKITEDFKTDKIVVLKGWILSLTEARQSALFFLIQK